jgi:hypothetical protein
MNCPAGTVWCAVSWPRRSALDASMYSTAPGIMNKEFCYKNGCLSSQAGYNCVKHDQFPAPGNSSLSDM